MSNKGPYIVEEIKKTALGTQFWGKYLVLEKSQRKTRDGREIVDLKIGDTSGEINVIIWDNCQVSGPLEAGMVIGLQGDTGSYNNKIQVTARRIKALEEDPSAYLKTPAQGLKKLQDDFEKAVKSIGDPYLQDLLKTILSPAIKQLFFAAPAAKRIHHHYYGGLLEHTLFVVELCEKAASTYPYLNRDLLVTGAILHDIGKIEEYQMNVTAEYTLAGRMLGHIVLGNNMVEKAIAQIRESGGNFPEMLEMMIKHMVLSHHGTLEFGSPVKPLFPEAFVLHMADNLDAKMFVYQEKFQEENQLDHMTSYDNFHQQPFFTYRYNYEEGRKDNAETE